MKIQPDIDNLIDRPSYDAHFYEGNNDGDSLHLTPTDSFENSLDNLSVTDIHTFMDKISNQQHTIKQFTTADLQKHINDHWRLPKRVQVDSGALDCITNDKNLLKQYRNVKSRQVALLMLLPLDAKLKVKVLWIL